MCFDFARVTDGYTKYVFCTVNLKVDTSKAVGRHLRDETKSHLIGCAFSIMLRPVSTINDFNVLVYVRFLI